MIRSSFRAGSRHAVGTRTAATSDRPRGHSPLRRWLLRLTLLALVGAGIGSQRHALLAGVGSLRRLSPVWFAVAILAEVISFAALAEVQRRLLAAGGIRIGRGTMVLLGYASGAVSASLPAGSALGTRYTYRQLTKRGAAPALAARSIVAWGIAALYLLIAVEITSLVRRSLPNRLWRRVHYASFPIFALATIHGVAAGRTPEPRSP
jgi:putative heme transporter